MYPLAFKRGPLQPGSNPRHPLCRTNCIFRFASRLEKFHPVALTVVCIAVEDQRKNCIRKLRRKMPFVFMRYKIYSENDRYDQVELRYRLIIMKYNIKYACKERNLPDLIEK